MSAYYKLSKGKITPVKGGDSVEMMSGLLSGLWVKTETFKNADGKEVSNEKLYLTIKNGSDYNHISTFFDGGLTKNIVSFLGSADITQELELHTSLDDKGYPQAFIKQNGFFLKGSFKGTDLPSWVKVQVSKTVTAWNKDEYNEALRAKVEELAAKLPKFERTQSAASPAQPAYQYTPSKEEDLDSQLPF